MVSTNPNTDKSKGNSATSGGGNQDSAINRVTKKISKERETESESKPEYKERVLTYKQDKLKLDRERLDNQKANREKKDQERKNARDERIAKAERKKDDQNIATQKSKVTSLKKRAEKTGSTPNKYGLGKKEMSSNKDGSVTATGKVGMNIARAGVTAVSAARSSANRIRTAVAANRLKKMKAERDAKDNPPATSQKPSTPPKPSVGDRMKTAITNTRRKAGSGIEKFGKKLANEDFIHEAEKDTSKEVEKDSSKEVKKKTIDVMKGKNAVEVNPKIQAEETMSPAQKRKDTNLKKKYDDSDMKQNMIDQYGEEEGMKVYYATIRKQAMKEAKIDQTMTGYEKRLARNERESGKKYEPVDSLDKPGTKIPKTRLTKWDQNYRQERHKEKRGVKKVKGNMTLKDRVGEMRGMTRPNRLARIAKHSKKIDVTDVKKYKDGSSGGTTEYSHYEPKGPVVMESGLEVQNVSDGLKFREYEFIDVIKNEPMKSPKNNITWTEEVGPDGEGLTPSEQRKGLGLSGSGIRKLKKKMQGKGNFDVETNLKKKTPDEQHTTTTSEETINEISADLAGKAARAASKKYQYADSNETKSKAYKQTQKFATYADKKYRKLNKDRGDLSRIYNKPDAVKEAKAPVGLMKLAATVAANNKKRKNALQIQKYIGEETPDSISGKDLKRISALSGKKTRFGDGPEGTAKRKAALEKKRGMKLDDHPQFKTEGKGSNPNKRYIGDPIVTSKKSFSKTGKIGIDYYTDDEKKKSEKEKLKDAKDSKKNMSRERATQNMQMIKRMTPEQKYARKMRIKQQQKDKK